MFRLAFIVIVLSSLPIPVHAAPPAPETAPLVLRADPAIFSPDGDGFQDQTFFYPVLNRSLEPIRWRVDIENASGRRVGWLNGSGIPALVPWEGRGRKNERLPDGLYEARFRLWARDARLSARRSVRIDTIPPAVQLSVSQPILAFEAAQATSFIFTPLAIDVSPIDRSQLQVLNRTGRTVYLAWSSGTAASFEWDGRDKATNVLAPTGDYRVAFQVWDAAGNGSEPAFVDVSIEMTPADMLSRAVERIRYFKTRDGYIVQLRADRLFKPKGGRWELSDEGQVLLREAGILIHAFPSAAIELNGYAQGKNSAEGDRDQSSVFAWTVYSHLVKKENVSGSRFDVRGRGRFPQKARRAIKPAPIRNGVEIVLRGAPSSAP